MGLATMNVSAMSRFDAICKTVAARGRGLTMKQIGDASALAQELERADPDPERVEFLRDRLGLDEGAEAPIDASSIPT